MSESKVTELPVMEKITEFNECEVIIQIMPFGNNSLACLTSQGRVLTPAEGFGQWVILPTPSIFNPIK